MILERIPPKAGRRVWTFERTEPRTGQKLSAESERIISPRPRLTEELLVFGIWNGYSTRRTDHQDSLEREWSTVNLCQYE